MIIDIDDLKKIHLHSKLQNEEYDRQPGKEHYKLLSYLSSQINGSIIFDIGTHQGYSAAALSSNKNNAVFTFDLMEKISIEDREQLWPNNNVVFSTDDLMDNEVRNKWKDMLLNSSIIFLDIDPHEGTREYHFYVWLKENNYKGLLILDDIHYFKEMRDNLWHKIPSCEKYDATSIGHWSGTGFVTFNNQSIEIYDRVPTKVPKYTSDKNWTIVTAYFNLTKTNDASFAIKERDINYYMKQANMTMALDQNLVVYCDSESESYLRSLRPSHLEHKTRYVITEFMDIDIVKNNYHRIVDSRNRTGYNADPRNTPSYYLFCMARYELLLRTMNDNPFNSSHFAWCNICIERMSWKGDIFFPKIWQEFRDKFSTCYIDYQPKTLVVDNINEYYQWGRCGMCSGFFTGNKYYMREFCNEIIKSFYEMLSLELGHADEQLYSIVYFRRPELFEFYFGDYTEMIVNYLWVNDKPNEPVKNFIRNLYNSGENWPLLKNATSRWLQSHSYGCFTIDDNTLNYVKNIYNEAVCKSTTLF